MFYGSHLKDCLITVKQMCDWEDKGLCDNREWQCVNWKIKDCVITESDTVWMGRMEVNVMTESDAVWINAKMKDCDMMTESDTV